METPKQPKQTAFSIELKLAILEAVDQGGKKKTDVARDFGIAQSTLSTIIKQRDKITAACEETCINPGRKRLRLSRYADVDKAVFEWCQQAQKEGVRLSGPVIRAKAKEYATELNHPKFACSKGWLSRFKNRHGIVFPRNAERDDPLQHIRVKDELEDSDILNENESCDLGELLQHYKPCDVYCAHGFALFWSALPAGAFENLDKTLADQAQKHVTVLLAANMDGSKKLPLRVVIDKSGQSLAGLMNVKSNSPVEYTYSDGAVLTPEIFVQWIQHVDKLFDMEDRQVCFLVDRSKAYPRVTGLHAIRLVHVLCDEVINCQPCQQGIAQFLKIIYRLRLAQKLTAYVDDKNVSFTLLDALRILREAWKAVPDEIIQQAFEKAGFVINAAYDGATPMAVFSQPSENALNTKDVPDLIESIKKRTDISSDLEKACMNLALQHFHAVDDSVLKPATPPTAKQANEAVKTLIHFFESQNHLTTSVDNHVLSSLHDIEYMIRTAAVPKH